MRKGIIIGIALLALLSAMAGHAAVMQGDTIYPPRPQVGIVLGGGGAKGAAHIGVLKYIEELGIPVDYVAGTSMGSIIGGLYALGYTPNEIEELISNLDWGKYMSNTIERRDASSADKLRRSTYLVNIPFNHGQFIDKLKTIHANNDNQELDPRSLISSLPDSFIGGTDLLNLFNSLCIGYQDTMNFNDLPIPFACVATDLTTGEPVVIRSGKFPEAIRASMSIPGVFSPITIDGKMLVDGGLTNNFPADVCREMGADIVIGIEVAQGMISDTNQLKSLPQMAAQMKNIMVKGRNEENRELCDLYIHPQVNDFSMLSFNAKAIDTIVQRGYQYASKAREELLTIKRYINSFKPSYERLQPPRAQNVILDTIQLESIVMDNVNPKEFDWLLRKSRLQLHQKITEKEIQRAIDVFKGTGFFNAIQYRLSPVEQSPSSNRFNLHFKFLPSEPHSLSVGLNYNSEESAAAIVNLGVGQNKFSGLKFNLNSRLGLNTKVNATLTYAGLSLANFNIAYDFQHVKYNTVFEDLSEAWALNRHRIRFYISEFHLRNIQTRVGVEAESFFYPRLRNSSWGPFATFKYDNMDHAYFANKGLMVNAEIHERFCKDHLSPLCDLFLAVKYHVSSGRFTFIPQLYSRCVISNRVPYAYYNIIGGDVFGRYYDFQLPFVGINNTFQTDDFTGIARLDVRYRIHNKHYVIAIVDAVRSAFNFGTLVSLNDEGIGHWGCGLKYSYDSPIGPLSFDIHYSNLTQDWGSYFSLGYIF